MPCRHSQIIIQSVWSLGLGFTLDRAFSIGQNLHLALYVETQLGLSSRPDLPLFYIPLKQQLFDLTLFITPDIHKLTTTTMLFIILATALAFVATAAATPAVNIQDLTTDAALNALITDSFSGAFPGVVIPTASMDTNACRTSRDCPPCKKCTLCDNWKPGCCKRLSPVCGSVDADAVLALDVSPKPLCTFCSSKTCFQIECNAGDEPGAIIEDANRIPTSSLKSAQTLYDFNLVLDNYVESAGDCDGKGIACAEGACWVKTC